ncbi:MAG: hypothetical protein AAF322_05390 [Pseudomonadota bacterium]
MDALDPPVRFAIPPVKRGDRPQAKGPIADLKAVAHVICHATYDADHLQIIIADDLGASALIKPDATRETPPKVDWAPYK